MVAEPAAPRLRPDLVVRRIAGEEEVYYVVKDPVTRDYLRFPEAAGQLLAQLDGKTSLPALQQRLLAAGAPAPGLEALEEFVQELRAMNLLELSPAERLERLLEQRRQAGKRSAWSRRAVGSILHARVPVWDPDRWLDWAVPRLRFLWTPMFFALSLVAVLVAGGIVAAEWELFEAALQRFFSGRAGWRTYLLVGLISFVVIGIHELGHAFACKRFGGHVHEIGLLMMYFMPCFYCNVDDAWLFERRSERLWVTLAGGYIELFIGALATFVWWLTQPGHPVNEIAFQAALMASFSSVAFNLNPLIKLDGYYLLSDYLGIPNLRERAFRYLEAQARHHLLRQPAALPDLSPRRQRILLAYGLLAGVYSVALLALIAQGVFQFLVLHAGDWGVLLFLAGVTALVGRPVWRKVAVLKRSGPIRQRTSTSTSHEHEHEPDSPRRLYAWLLLAGLLIALATLPRWRMPIRLRCVFEPGRTAVLHAPEDGQVIEVQCAEGQAVAVGEPLLRLRATELETEQTRVRLQLAIHRQRAAAAQAAHDLAAWQAQQRRVEALHQEEERLQRRTTGLALSSPLAGLCLTARPLELMGRPVRRGVPLIRVGDTGWLLAVARVAPEVSGEIRPGAAARVMSNAQPGRELHGTVREFIPAGKGGRVALRLTILVRNPGGLRPGMSGSLKLYGPPRSLVGHLYEAVLRLLRADLWG